MGAKFERVKSIAAIGLAFVLMLPSAGFADDEQYAGLRPATAGGLKVGRSVSIPLKTGSSISGVVHEVSNDGVVIEYDSEAGLVRQMVAFDDMQTVIKPSVRRWWQKASRVALIVGTVALAAFLVTLAVAGGEL